MVQSGWIDLAGGLEREIAHFMAGCMGVIAQCGRARTRRCAVATVASVVAIWTLSGAGIAT
ncbi:hypothetical protein A7D35_12475 [Xanthomonas arboricola]|nr:hypothetical protein AN651_01845 [Xanthomonas arboricola]OBR73680.1 hypothetical protein A7D35_12475 [Xanthomonas arboricola]